LKSPARVACQKIVTSFEDGNVIMRHASVSVILDCAHIRNGKAEETKNDNTAIFGHSMLNNNSSKTKTS